MKKLVASLFIVIWSCSLSAQELWVSPDGSGAAFSEANPGSLSDYSGLKSKISGLRNVGIKHVRVNLKEGVYPRTFHINVGNDMTGTATDTLSFIGVSTNAYQDDGKVVLSGGQKVTGWQLADNGIYTAQLPATADFRQLYVNGKMAVRARYPNRTDNQHFGPYFKIHGFYPDADSNFKMLINSSEISDWDKPGEVEMVIHQHWVHSRVKISSYEKLAYANNYTIVTLGWALVKWATNDLSYFWENSLDFLDMEDEWYLDRDTKVLYYKPGAGEDINQLDIVYPVAEKLLNIEGTASVPVRNVFFENIEFKYSNWAAPNTVPAVRCNIGVELLDGNISVSSAIQARYAEGIHLVNCNVFSTGGHGVNFISGVNNSEITACHFDQIAASGIVVNESYQTMTSSDIRLSNNLIENYGMNYTSGLGYSARNTPRMIVENNEIRFGRYGGSQIGGGDINAEMNCMVRYNNVHHVMWLHDDCGGIYVCGWLKGS
ncbi:MAG: right-handed parallel beta-helix repeat-containing protein, partial [Tannerella sp.]|nr:right-handed parallel beta-helix repeat-containing protein [Tannerella sp.]